MGELVACVWCIGGFVAAGLLSGIGTLLFSIVAVMSLAGGIASAVYVTRMRTALEATKDAGAAWKEEREAEKAKAERLEQQIMSERIEQQQLRHELKDQLATVKAQNALLEAKTDLSAHEAAAVARSEATLGVLQQMQASLEQIAGRLAPSNE